MRELSGNQIELAVTTLERIVDSRGLTQTELAQLSGVKQSTISKVKNRSQMPSEEILKKLFQAIGYKLSDVLNENDGRGYEILGYLATPLTGVVKDARSDSELKSVVDRLKEIAASGEFVDPVFDLYWPGDYTHPVRNPQLAPSQVYLTDRSRASTHDFIILFCAAPSYGVGQENEIATQAGIPAIRLMPEGMSRMMTGAFIKSIDVKFTGSLEKGVHFDLEDFRRALREIRRLYFHYRPLFKEINGENFGARLKKLVDSRSGNYRKFAEDLGVSLSYVHVLMAEHPSVSNPSLRLLKKISVLLGENVNYLVGESERSDIVWSESSASWHAWATENPGLDAAMAIAVRDQWRGEYRETRAQPSVASFRRVPKVMQKTDWDQLYKERVKMKDGSKTKSLF